MPDPNQTPGTYDEGPIHHLSGGFEDLDQMRGGGRRAQRQGSAGLDLMLAPGAASQPMQAAPITNTSVALGPVPQVMVAPQPQPQIMVAPPRPQEVIPFDAFPPSGGAPTYTPSGGGTPTYTPPSGGYELPPQHSAMGMSPTSYEDHPGMLANPHDERYEVVVGSADHPGVSHENGFEYLDLVCPFPEARLLFVNTAVEAGPGISKLLMIEINGSLLFSNLPPAPPITRFDASVDPTLPNLILHKGDRISLLVKASVGGAGAGAEIGLAVPVGTLAAGGFHVEGG
jgi:hypothetical protein